MCMIDELIDHYVVGVAHSLLGDHLQYERDVNHHERLAIKGTLALRVWISLSRR